jgi:hypothetical protein
VFLGKCYLFSQAADWRNSANNVGIHGAAFEGSGDVWAANVWKISTNVQKIWFGEFLILASFGATFAV